MHIFQQLLLSTIPAGLVLLVFLPVGGCSSHNDHQNQANTHKIIKQDISRASHQRTFDITLHGVLLWVSVGFLMPLGILAIRMSNRDECGRTRLKLLFYIHAISQVLAVLLASIGAVLSIKSFENSFNNSHQRIGLALYGAIWVQALAGFRRPKRGTKGRTVWYFFHWILGTTISLAGIFNIYTGLKAYQKRTSRSITLWTILFTSEVSFMGLFYLFQDKWEYIQKQGVILDTAPNTHSDQVLPQRENHKEVLTEPCAKSNALGSYFSRSNALRKLFQLT